MSDETAVKRRLSARDRRESTAKRRASTPAQSVAPATPSTSRKTSTPAATAASEPRQKRAYTKRGSQVRVPTPVSRDSPAPSVVEDALPTKIAADQPLPTTKERQAPDLSLKDYQSISDSAILAASLHRSRMQWLYDGIFEKYWVKPFKRKGVVQQPPNNPDVKTMSKLGLATITIEPHTFDAVFYVVRDPTVLQPVYPRHANQHTPKAMLPQLNASPRPAGMYPPPAPYQSQPTTPALISKPPQVSYQNHAATPPSVSGPPPSANTNTTLPPAPLGPPGPSRTPQQPPSVPSTTVTPVKQEPPVTPSPVAPPPPTPPSVSPNPPPPPTPPSVSPNPPPPAPKPTPVHNPTERSNTPANTKGGTTDPVIQMLAARAATDTRLKELMKVVATSKASPEQLKEFQAHIDEFNQVIRKQEAERSAQAGKGSTPKPVATNSGSLQPGKGADSRPNVQAAAPKPGTSNPGIPAHSPPGPASTPVASGPHPPPYKPQVPPPAAPRQQMPPPGPTTLPGVMHRFPPAPSSGPARPMTGYMGYPAAPAPGPPPRQEPVIKHVVLEITSTPSATQSASSDRWLFPEHAVLEIQPSGLEMLCSFFVEKKGKDLVAPDGGGEPAAMEESGGSGSGIGSGIGKHGKFSADKEYYQPVTMTIKVTQHKTIATIAQAAKPLATVQEYMKEVMAKKERAPSEYLVHQLPREKGTVAGEGVDMSFVDSGVEIGSGSDVEEDELKDVYGI